MQLRDKITKCNDSLTVYMYDNGYMVEVSGRSVDDDYKTAKILCQSLDEVFEVIKDASAMEHE